ncbi:MAG: hypothetical protein INQ03_00100 [Candidatus Heimdallarchaeota archaeon]|nr:hypothetical protein [Candidatus Heimdallarchaeota archaeon]
MNILDILIILLFALPVTGILLLQTGILLESQYIIFLLVLLVIGWILGFRLISNLTDNSYDRYFGAIIFSFAYVLLSGFILEEYLSGTELLVDNILSYPLFLSLIVFLLGFSLIEWIALVNPEEADAITPLQMKMEQILEKLTRSNHVLVIVVFLVIHSLLYLLIYLLVQDFVFSLIILALVFPLINLGYITGVNLGQDLLWAKVWLIHKTKEIKAKTSETKDYLNDYEYYVIKDKVNWIDVNWEKKRFGFLQVIGLGIKSAGILAVFLLFTTINSLYSDLSDLSSSDAGGVGTGILAIISIARLLILNGRNAIAETMHIHDALIVKKRISRFNKIYPMYVLTTIFMLLLIEFLTGVSARDDQIMEKLFFTEIATYNFILLFQTIILVTVALAILVFKAKPLTLDTNDEIYDDLDNLSPLERFDLFEKLQNDVLLSANDEMDMRDNIQKILDIAPDKIKINVIMEYINSTYDSVQELVTRAFPEDSDGELSEYILAQLEEIDPESRKKALDVIRWHNYIPELESLVETGTINGDWVKFRLDTDLEEKYGYRDFSYTKKYFLILSELDHYEYNLEVIDKSIRGFDPVLDVIDFNAHTACFLTNSDNSVFIAYLDENRIKISRYEEGAGMQDICSLVIDDDEFSNDLILHKEKPQAIGLQLTTDKSIDNNFLLKIHHTRINKRIEYQLQFNDIDSEVKVISTKNIPVPFPPEMMDNFYFNEDIQLFYQQDILQIRDMDNKILYQLEDKDDNPISINCMDVFQKKAYFGINNSIYCIDLSLNQNQQLKADIIELHDLVHSIQVNYKFIVVGLGETETVLINRESGKIQSYLREITDSKAKKILIRNNIIGVSDVRLTTFIPISIAIRYAGYPPYHKQEICDLRINGSHLFTLSIDNVIKKWDSKSLKELNSLEINSIASTRIALDTEDLYLVTAEKELLVIDQKNLEVNKQEVIDIAGRPQSILVDDQYIYIGTYPEGEHSEFKIFDKNSLSQIFHHQDKGEMKCISCDSDFVYLGVNGSLVIFEQKNGSFVEIHRYKQELDEIYIDFQRYSSEDGCNSVFVDDHHIYVAGYDKIIVLKKDSRTSFPVIQQYGPYLRPNPDDQPSVLHVVVDKHYVIASTEQDVHVWDKISDSEKGQYRTRAVFSAHKAIISALEINENHIYTTSFDKTIRKFEKPAVRDFRSALIKYLYVVPVAIPAYFLYSYLSSFLTV